MSFNKGIFFPLSLFESTVYVRFCMQHHCDLRKGCLPVDLRSQRVEPFASQAYHKQTSAGITVMSLSCLRFTGQHERGARRPQPLVLLCSA